MNIVDTKDLQQQVLDDFAFHLGYDRDHSTGNYKRDLFHTCHSPFRRLNFNTMVLLYNILAHTRNVYKEDAGWLFEATCVNMIREFPVLRVALVKHQVCPTPIETICLQRSKKQNKILCHKHQIKFSECEDGQLMKEDFEEKYYGQE